MGVTVETIKPGDGKAFINQVTRKRKCISFSKNISLIADFPIQEGLSRREERLFECTTLVRHISLPTSQRFIHFHVNCKIIPTEI